MINQINLYINKYQDLEQSMGYIPCNLSKHIKAVFKQHIPRCCRQHLPSIQEESDLRQGGNAKHFRVKKISWFLFSSKNRRHIMNINSKTRLFNFKMNFFVNTASSSKILKGYGCARVAMILVGLMPEGYSWVWGMPWTYHGGF